MPKKAKPDRPLNNGNSFSAAAKVRHKRAAKEAIRKAEALEAAGLPSEPWSSARMLLDKKGDLILDPETKKIRQALFFEGYVETGTISGGCRAAGISRFTYQEWRRSDPEFLALMNEAEEIVSDDLEETAAERAKDKSDLLMMFLLKKRRPEFRDNFKGEAPEKVKPATESSARLEIERRLSNLADRSKEAPKLVTGKVKTTKVRAPVEED